MRLKKLLAMVTVVFMVVPLSAQYESMPTDGIEGADNGGGDGGTQHTPGWTWSDCIEIEFKIGLGFAVKECVDKDCGWEFGPIGFDCLSGCAFWCLEVCFSDGEGNFAPINIVGGLRMKVILALFAGCLGGVLAGSTVILCGIALGGGDWIIPVGFVAALLAMYHTYKYVLARIAR